VVAKLAASLGSRIRHGGLSDSGLNLDIGSIIESPREVKDIHKTRRIYERNNIYIGLVINR